MARNKTGVATRAGAGSANAADRAATETPDYSALLQANGAAVAAALRAGEAMLEGWAEINREMMNFASDRLRRSLETSESLMGCQDPTQAFGVQCEHARQATQAYLEEATRLMSLAAKLSEDCLTPIEAQARETLDQIGRTAKRAQAG